MPRLTAPLQHLKKIDTQSFNKETPLPARGVYHRAALRADPLARRPLPQAGEGKAEACGLTYRAARFVTRNDPSARPLPPARFDAMIAP